MATDFSEKWGTDVDTAVKLALDDLKLTIDEVDVTVLEEPSRGFFGIGSKLALVRVEKKKADGAKAPEVKKEQVVEKAEKAQPQKPAAPKKEIVKEEVVVKKDFKEDIKEENLVPCEEHEALDFLRKVTGEMASLLK